MLVDAKTGQDLLVRGPVKAQSILPSQYFDRGAGRSENVGELKLLLAVLTDGISCFLKKGSRKHRLFLEAKDWIIMPYRTGPFAFDSICEALGIEADTLRKRLVSLRRLSQPSRTDAERMRLHRQGATACLQTYR
jgi:hypothetical protein